MLRNDVDNYPLNPRSDLDFTHLALTCHAEFNLAVNQNGSVQAGIKLLGFSIYLRFM